MATRQPRPDAKASGGCINLNDRLPIDERKKGWDRAEHSEAHGLTRRVIMKLIKRIEVNYLRSLYGATISEIGDLNVIFGRNDSGKSNLLRALNLFFNNMVDPGQELSFDLDMSDHRKQEARDAKGKQFIWIKITFNVPQNYVSTLGREISIKRQWNRDGDLTETVSPELNTSGKQARLTRFLNDIDFTYIPAIKDLTVYADLIERMYSAASETEVLRNATDDFVRAIAGQTSSLAEQLTQLFGAPAALAPPTEMSRLFRNLDFAHGADGHSMLRQKGDGVKARHLPELIRFINEKEPRKKLFLWGFEEPENSLDLSAAEAEARRFASFSERSDTQVFITSHSPAFYLANCDTNLCAVRRHFITKQVPNEGNVMFPKNAASMINDLTEAEQRMEQAGLLQLPFIIRHMGDQRRAIQDKEQEAETLRLTIKELQRPTLFVEGIHDVDMFKSAAMRLGRAELFEIKPLGGTPQTTEALFTAILEQGGVAINARTVFLFDDDKAGRGAARKLIKTTPSFQPTPYGKNSHVLVLNRTNEFDLFLKRRSISNEQAFFTAEFLFPAEQAAQLCLELTNSSKAAEVREWKQQINGDYWPAVGQKTCGELVSATPGSVDWFFARGVPACLKHDFSEEARKRKFNTEQIDNIAATVAELLLG